MLQEASGGRTLCLFLLGIHRYRVVPNSVLLTGGEKFGTMESPEGRSSLETLPNDNILVKGTRVVCS